MKRRTILILALGATLLGAGGWWSATHFERVAVPRYHSPGPEALRDRYLALERFMARMGRPLATTGDVRTLATLKPGGVIILDRHHRAIMTRERLKALFDWVGKGGYLIVIPEYRDEPDPVLSYLHVRWEDSSTGSCGCRSHATLPSGKTAPASAPHAASAPAASSASANDGAAEGDADSEDDDDGDAPAAAQTGASALIPASAPAATPRPASALGATPHLPASAPAAASAPASASASGTGADADDEGDDDADVPSAAHPNSLPAYIPGSTKPLAIEMQYWGLTPGDINPAWQVALEDKSDWLLHYRYGQGNVSLIVNLDQVVSNNSIDDFDHAEFFWKLLQHYQPKGPVMLMTHLPIPDLFDWLADTAWAASLSGVVLIALWLWAVAPRFGGTAPDVPPSRRELREHLNAVGRFVWRNEGLNRWLEVARASFRERLAMRHPAIAAMDPEGQAEALARLTSLPRQAIFFALTGGAGNASDFTAMLRTLKHLKHNL